MRASGTHSSQSLHESISKIDAMTKKRSTASIIDAQPTKIFNQRPRGGRALGTKSSRSALALISTGWAPPTIKGGVMPASTCAVPRRHPGNNGRRYPADPPRVEEIVAVMRIAGGRPYGLRIRALIVLL